MTTRRQVVQVGRDSVGVTLWDDETATVTTSDGATVGREDLAQVLEALAAYARTGVLGPLPPGAVAIPRGG